ncbi:MAG: hypothetical protein ACO30M_10685, partial [Candidatus Kapaibacteriota bacterium]
MTSFPCWFRDWLPRPSSRDRDIAHGSSTLDANGAFTISFDAEKDPALNPLDAPVYSYSVKVDILAENGEMQTAETVIVIGTLKAKYAFTHKHMFTTKENADIQLSSTLYSGKPAKGMHGTIVIELLERKKHMQLPLPFEFGDVEGLSEKDKDILFRYDICDPADSPFLRKPTATVFSGSFTSDDFGLIKPKLPILKPGTYRARFIAENETMPFTLETTWSVIDPDAKDMSLDEHVLLQAIKTTLEPGDTASIIIGSAWKDASILMQIESRGKIIKQERFELSASMKQILIPITNAYRGGISIHVSLAKYNRLITKSMSLKVQWSNAKIAIKTSSLRDKTSPG